MSRRKNNKKNKRIFLLAVFELAMLLLVTVAIFLWLKPKGDVRDASISTDNVNLTINGELADGETAVSENMAEPVKEPAFLSQEFTPTSIYLKWEDTLYDNYTVLFKKSNDAEGVYLSKNTDAPEIVISGLEVNTSYEIHIVNGDNKEEEYLPASNFSTSTYGYCDPFKAVDAIINVYDRDPSSGAILLTEATDMVVMSAKDGVLGVNVKPIISTPLCSDETLTYEASTLSAGTNLYVTAGENGHYCYLSPEGDWVLHVTTDIDDSGWVNARALLVDVKAMFDDEAGLYGIQINRTNAYSSVFTTGGNAMSVNDYSEAETRYNCISENNIEVQLLSDGLNTIEGITSEILPNYGSAQQMPVIWDLALELKTCQRTALMNGYSILIYDGYRPLSTSQAVSGYLANLGYLSTSMYGTDLAQGYLTNGVYNIYYYIAQRSRHNRGIAADLTIVEYASIDELGQEGAMQTKMHTLDFRCNMEYNTWAANLLYDIMTTNGSNLEALADKQEWWHFQLNTSRTDLYPLVEQYGYSDIVF